MKPPHQRLFGGWEVDFRKKIDKLSPAAINRYESLLLQIPTKDRVITYDNLPSHEAIALYYADRELAQQKLLITLKQSFMRNGRVVRFRQSEHNKTCEFCNGLSLDSPIQTDDFETCPYHRYRREQAETEYQAIFAASP